MRIGWKLSAAIQVVAFALSGGIAAAEDAKPPAAAAAAPPAGSPPPAGGAPATPKSDAVAPGAAGTGWSAEVAIDAKAGITLDDKQTATLKSVSTYFNDLTTLKGNFVQLASDQKRMRGKFYVNKPGRFRFDYNLPSRQIIISDGEYLAIQDLDLNNEDRVDLDNTPFRLLLRKDVDLARDAVILEVQEAEDLVVIGLRDKDPNTPGRIKLFLATKPAMELKEWITTDAQGQDTRVEISEVKAGEEIDAKLFKIEPVGLTRQRP